MVNSAKPNSTVNKTRWSVNVFNSWKLFRNVNCTEINDIPDDILEMNPFQMNTCLGFFVAEVKTVTGDDYYPNTLYELVTSLQYHIRSNGTPINLLEDDSFYEMRQILDAKMKELSAKGLGSKKRQAEIITEEEENQLWARNILGEDTPEQLIHTILYLIGLNFALRAGKEHRNLRVGTLSQLTIGKSGIYMYIIK